MKKTKSKYHVGLASKRWGKTTKKQRSEHAKMMARKRWGKIVVLSLLLVFLQSASKCFAINHPTTVPNSHITGGKDSNPHVIKKGDPVPRVTGISATQNDSSQEDIKDTEDRKVEPAPQTTIKEKSPVLKGVPCPIITPTAVETSLEVVPQELIEKPQIVPTVKKNIFQKFISWASNIF